MDHFVDNHADVLMECLSWMEYRDRVQQGNVIFIPVGSIEQHGPHLPLGTDMYMSQGVSALAARKLGAMVAHPISYGYKSMPRSGGGNHFPGTTSLDGHTLSLMMCDLLREFNRHGARHIVVLNGHFENTWFLTEGIELFMRERGDANTRIMRLDYWDFIDPETVDTVFGKDFTSWALEHAAIMETSCMMAMHPDKVKPQLIPDEPPADFPCYDHFPTHTHWVPSSGVLSSAKKANSEKGELMLNDFTTLIAKAVRTEFPDVTKVV
ncbi:MAG: creatininase [Oculatellaceae cyanobacterium bins.114]|nr:creatininase [Oculatellaceae cyanobacterium bins.114]